MWMKCHCLYQVKEEQDRKWQLEEEASKQLIKKLANEADERERERRSLEEEASRMLIRKLANEEEERERERRRLEEEDEAFAHNLSTDLNQVCFLPHPLYVLVFTEFISFVSLHRKWSLWYPRLLESSYVGLSVGEQAETHLHPSHPVSTTCLVCWTNTWWKAPKRTLAWALWPLRLPPHPTRWAVGPVTPTCLTWRAARARNSVSWIKWTICRLCLLLTSRMKARTPQSWWSPHMPPRSRMAPSTRPPLQTPWPRMRVSSVTAAASRQMTVWIARQLSGGSRWWSPVDRSSAAWVLSARTASRRSWFTLSPSMPLHVHLPDCWPTECWASIPLW